MASRRSMSRAASKGASCNPWEKKDVPAHELQTFLNTPPYNVVGWWGDGVVERFFKHNLTKPEDANWLGEAVEFTPSLAGLTNSGGSRAIDVAEEACKQAMQAGLHRALATVNSGLERAHRSATKSGSVQGKVVPADQLYTFLLEQPISVDNFFKQNLKDKNDAAWLGEAVELTPKLAGLPNVTRVVQSSKDGVKFGEVKVEFAIRYAAPECKTAMEAGLNSAIEEMNYPLPKLKDSWAANYKEKPGAGMHVAISTKHSDPGDKKGHYLEISTRAKEALKEMGCTVYNPNTDNPPEYGDQGWSLSFTNNLYFVAQTKGFVYQLQQGEEGKTSDTQLAEEHMGEQWQGCVPVVGAKIPSFDQHKWDNKGDSMVVLSDFQLRYDTWRAIHCARRQWNNHLVLPVVEPVESLTKEAPATGAFS